jgi:hypothetical protein
LGDRGPRLKAGGTRAGTLLAGRTLNSMARSISVEQSRAIPVAVEEAFAKTLPIPLPLIFTRWYGLIPPIKQVRDQTGEWEGAGQTRTVLMVGGGSAQEVLTGIDPPHSFSYTLSGMKGPLALLVSLIEGEWTFTPAGTGTAVSWRWTVHARSAAAAPALPAFGAMWKGYARQALEKLSAELLR